MKRLLIAIAGVVIHSETQAQQCLSLRDGNWNQTSTWSCDGVNRLPNCGDTVRVLSGDIVSVTNQNNYEACGSEMVIDVAGILQFTNGNKLELPCNSLLSVQEGGLVRKSGAGGGTSTLISICDNNVWTAGDGPLNGPVGYGGEVLPVTLVDFEVARQDEYFGFVAWATAVEVQSDFFTVEYSTDFQNWEAIQRIEAAGNSKNRIDYWVNFELKNSEYHYIKVTQTDHDGTVNFIGTGTIVTPQLMLEKTNVYPNPAAERITVDFKDNGHRKIELLEADGQLYGVWESSERSVSINLTSYRVPNGVYFLKITDASGQREIIRFVVGQGV